MLAVVGTVVDEAGVVDVSDVGVTTWEQRLPKCQYSRSKFEFLEEACCATSGAG